MASISNYLKRRWPQNPDGHPLTPFFILLLLSIPFAYAIGNVALMLFAAASLMQFYRTRRFFPDLVLYLPIALFVLMAASLLWSIDLPRSIKALPRMIFLLAIPVCCLLVPRFDAASKRKILESYGYGMACLALFYLLKALLRFVASADPGVFFYHELVTEEVNAVHVSAYVIVAFFALLAKSRKKPLDWLAIVLLAVLLVLLSSKNLIVVFALLLLVHYLFYSGLSYRARVVSFSALAVIVLLPLVFFPKITDRYRLELRSAWNDSTPNRELAGVYNVSVRQAWEQQQFRQNDYFPGVAFRVYQFRVFIELLQEDGRFWGGYGLNASFRRIGDKAAEHGLFHGDRLRKGYQGKNFHDQYVQNFAELGIFGLLLLVAMLILTLKKGLDAKDFTHISFAIVMISLFLTESFLWRQRGVMFFTAMYCLMNSGWRREKVS